MQFFLSRHIRLKLNLRLCFYKTIDDKASFSELSRNGVVTNRYDPSSIVYGLSITDDYFTLKNYQTTNAPVSLNSFMQHIIVDDDNKPGYYYIVAHSFLPKKNKLDGTPLEYTCEVAFVTANYFFLIEFGVHVHQQPGQLM
ncbi:hypothetical protein [Pseudescherichia sp.]|uniref:hypothetical protein n=1 Tax=Pseudescherichia sp. TaxID=2055881 RepID=UPI002898E253|nr:hypothetical protein [Pseudescherichia sp.]